MKVNNEVIEKLKADLKARVARSGLSYSEIGRNAGIHASQVSRICRGQFKSLSQNVVQICDELDIKIEGFVATERRDPDAARLVRNLLSVWKRTPEDADRISALLDGIRELRKEP